MPESVVLDKIRAITDKFDTSIDALIVLKQAGATEAELKAIMAQGAAPADATPAAAPTTGGPSLAETMKFIQAKLNDMGKVGFVVFFQDTSNGSTSTENFTNEISNVVADQNICRISYHRVSTDQGQTYKDENDIFLLRNVQDIMVRPYEQAQTEWFAEHGRTLMITSTNPPLMELEARRPHGEENFFVFTDADLADRVAKAMLHAVELCGGGSKDKF
jgi:hypothetical protein